LIENLKNEISRLQNILEEKEIYLESLTDEKNKLVDHYRKVADDQDETFREKKLSLEKQIKKKEEDLLFTEKEMGELIRTKHYLENEVEHKLYVLHKTEKEIVEKEREVWETIEESNRLRIEIETIKQ
jgi:peptidoglycan hydrolase CwlO-like protein